MGHGGCAYTMVMYVRSVTVSDRLGVLVKLCHLPASSDFYYSMYSIVESLHRSQNQYDYVSIYRRSVSIRDDAIKIGLLLALISSLLLLSSWHRVSCTTSRVSRSSYCVGATRVFFLPLRCCFLATTYDDDASTSDSGSYTASKLSINTAISLVVSRRDFNLENTLIMSAGPKHGNTTKQSKAKTEKRFVASR